MPRTLLLTSVPDSASEFDTYLVCLARSWLLWLPLQSVSLFSCHGLACRGYFCLCSAKAAVYPSACLARSWLLQFSEFDDDPAVQRVCRARCWVLQLPMQSVSLVSRYGVACNHPLCFSSAMTAV